MSSIQTIAIPITTTGSAGSATGSATSELLTGFLVDVYLDFHASAPNTTDTTLAYAVRGGNILALTNVNTDGLYQPRAQIYDADGVAISGLFEPFVLNNAVTLSVAGCNALTNAVIAYLRVLRP